MIQSPIIFVFGSNLDGNHAGGAARFAHLHHGAVMGVGEGLTGTSYALPTVGKSFTTMTLAKVREHVNTFIRFATSHPELDSPMRKLPRSSLIPPPTAPSTRSGMPSSAFPYGKRISNVDCSRTPHCR
jgi:hypothetical protein